MQVDQWQNRIVEAGVEDPNQLLANPFNLRIHPKAQQDALAGVLDAVGFVDRVIVNRRTGHVVDGHLRVALAISKGQKTIPVDYVDLTEDEERVVLASHDWISQMGAYDLGQVETLIDMIENDNARVQQILDDMRAEIEIPVHTSGDRKKLIDKHPHTVRLLIHVELAELFERAMEATGKKNRAEALEDICCFYLGEYEQR